MPAHIFRRRITRDVPALAACCLLSLRPFAKNANDPVLVHGITVEAAGQLIAKRRARQSCLSDTVMTFSRSALHGFGGALPSAGPYLLDEEFRRRSKPPLLRIKQLHPPIPPCCQSAHASDPDFRQALGLADGSITLSADSSTVVVFFAKGLSESKQHAAKAGTSLVILRRKICAGI